MRTLAKAVLATVVLFQASQATLAQPAPLPLFLKEDWKFVPADKDTEHAIAQATIETPGVQLKIYGQTPQFTDPDRSTKLKDTGVFEAKDGAGVTFIYTGPCLTPCALALRDENNYADLSGRATIKWRTRNSGFHFLRPIIKLADGTWLVGDFATGPATQFHVSEFAVADVRWKLLNVDYVVTARADAWVTNPDLSRVDEIGFTDMMPGSPDNHGHGAASASRIDWIEVYANRVSRE